MTALEKALSKMQKLPTAQQQQVLHFADLRDRSVGREIIL